jgi:hypothetical protein
MATRQQNERKFGQWRELEKCSRHAERDDYTTPYRYDEKFPVDRGHLRM